MHCAAHGTTLPYPTPALPPSGSVPAECCQVDAVGAIVDGEHEGLHLAPLEVGLHCGGCEVAGGDEAVGAELSCPPMLLRCRRAALQQSGDVGCSSTNPPAHLLAAGQQRQPAQVSGCRPRLLLRPGPPPPQVRRSAAGRRALPGPGTAAAAAPAPGGGTPALQGDKGVPVGHAAREGRAAGTSWATAIGSRPRHAVPASHSSRQALL